MRIEVLVLFQAGIAEVPRSICEGARDVARQIARS